MSELRQNPATKEWVIIAKERAKRPEDFPKRSQIPEKPEELVKCPFCQGNEHLTPPEILSYRSPGTVANSPGWWIRVVPNMFAALSPMGTLERLELNNFYRCMEGFGEHEVLIEHPHHLSIATMEQVQVEEIFLGYRERSIILSQDKRFEMVLVFKNHGQSAGTSVKHPHSQIIATPIIPMHIRHRLEEAMRHFDDRGRCVFCEMIENEIKCAERVVFETENFVAFEPFASKSPFETWILPKRHDSSFNSIEYNMAKEFAYISRIVMKKLHVGLGDPDYNYVIYSSPCHEKDVDYYHWRMQILPRINAIAGFELGSGIYINTVIPEEAARFLRELKVD